MIETGTRRCVAIVFVVVAVGSGCVTSRVVRRPTAPEAIQAINAAAGTDPPLEIDYQQPLPVEPPLRTANILLAADRTETTFVDTSGQRQSVESQRVKAVHVTNRARGATKGLAGGFLVGALFGVGSAAASESSWVIGQDTMMILAGTIGGLLGAIVGAAVGGAIGDRTVFVFEDAH